MNEKKQQPEMRNGCLNQIRVSINWKTKLYNTVGTIPKSKSQKEAKRDTHNKQIPFTFLALYRHFNKSGGDKLVLTPLLVKSWDTVVLLQQDQ